ncbi:protein singles bar-like [Limulus polyphemus]|uniref:Protein singles bar-like n=1 Tax=Limulus polyphemus TaxID=6850 RepID=A0ABM1BRI5_LIMPO|nr:protein singles bar-like [Limulus polyphemus]
MPTVMVNSAHTRVPHLQRRCYSIIHTEFLTTQPGICKVGEVVLGGICLGLTITYGTPVWLLLGPAYGFFLTTASATFLGAAVTLLSYLLSSHTFRAARTTILETVQNSVASMLYTGSSIFLLIRTYFILWPLYLVTPYFQAYPAMMAVSVFGLVAALVHAIDAVCAHRAFKQRR